ncbi:MAG TPA: patatin-like phospholipase family protein [Geminicoccaceae bacterium]|nr:patatin-like phospholipase family protein [Geminicoccaceae bacterium]
MLTGRLGVFRTEPGGRQRLVNEAVAGDAVGEMALLLGEPRSAGVAALRDSELLRLRAEAFDALLDRHPQLVLQLTRQLAGRLAHGLRPAPPRPAPRTLALLPLGPEPPAAPFARELARALGRLVPRVAVLAAGEAEDGSGERLDVLERTHDLVLYLAEPKPSPWTRLCLRQADQVLLLDRASRGGESAPEPAVLELLRRGAPRRVDLAVLQPEGAALPSPTAAAAAVRRSAVPIELVCHLRPGRLADRERLARLITGRAVGLVLSGGGARGLAHVGVVKALREAGVPLDLVGGTSMGAVVAACLAVEWDDAELAGRLRRAFVEANPLRDYTLPFVALVRGRVVASLLRDAFGAARIEDLWRPFFCLSTNLTSGRAVVHREGPLWRALRASAAIPGVLPPVVEAGEVLVDGGVVNNLPVDVMRGLGRGPVVAVDVAADRALGRAPAELEDGSPWRWLARGRRRVPSIAAVLMRAGTVSSAAQGRRMHRAADLLLRPPLAGVGMLDWRAFDRAVALGYRHARQALAGRDLGGR